MVYTVALSIGRPKGFELENDIYQGSTHETAVQPPPITKVAPLV